MLHSHSTTVWREPSTSWTPECDRAFQKTKQLLTVTPILGYPTADDPFVVDTDASLVGVGAVLSQIQDGKEKVISYFSHRLSKAESNYCVMRRELLAVIKALRNFYPYLDGKPFTLRTDHATLRWLLNFKCPDGRMARWITGASYSSTTSLWSTGATWNTIMQILYRDALTYEMTASTVIDWRPKTSYRGKRNMVSSSLVGL